MENNEKLVMWILALISIKETKSFIAIMWMDIEVV